MKLLFISKRRPQQRDLITRPYGRFYNLPIELSKLGNDVCVVLIDFHNSDTHSSYANGVRWISLDIKKLGLFTLLKQLFLEAKKFNPDWVFGLSDTWTGWLAYRLTKKLKCKLGIDAYDNYESYMPWNKPLHWLWRRAIKAADLVTVTGPQLANLLGKHRSDSSAPEIIPMSADEAFIAMDKSIARSHINLPLDCPIIGYYGGWANRRGTKNILEIFNQIKLANPNIKLVLSGNPPKSIKNQSGVICLGYIDDESLPYLVNAIDVACIITRNSTFGKFSYPAKLCEAIACKTPVVATATEPVAWMLGNNQKYLVSVDNPTEFSALVLNNINLGKVDYAVAESWKTSAKKLNYLLNLIPRKDG